MSQLHLVTSIHDLAVDQPINHIDGLGENRPTQRKQLVYVKLQEHNKQITNHLINLSHKQEANEHEIDQSNNTSFKCDLSYARIAHDEDYLKFLETAFNEWKKLILNKHADMYMSEQCSRGSDDEQSVIIESINQAVNPSAVPLFMPGQTANRVDRDINGQSHSLARPGSSVHSKICYYGLDRFTPIREGLAEDLTADLHVIKQAVDIICRSVHQNESSTVVYALTSHPGHHASRSSFGGFCYVNNACVSALSLHRSLNQRIALLDVDYHAGNGSQSILYSSNSVSFVSLHIHPDLDYPFNEGWSEDEGAGAGTGYNLNVALPAGTDWTTYRTHVERALERFKEQECGVLVVSLGVDTLKDDPECAPLGGFSLIQENYIELGHLLRGAGLPLLFISEGGYKLDEVPSCIRNTVLPDHQTVQ